MKHQFANRMKPITALTLLCLVIALLCGCSKESNLNTLSCNLDEASSYPEVLQQMLPSLRVEQSVNRAYYFLDNGAISEAFDAQAVGALEVGIAEHWYPQYLATVIIAVDRNQTNAAITGWNDLTTTQEQIAFFDTSVDEQMLLAAMSYGLEGEAFSLRGAIDLLALLQGSNRLVWDTFEAPIIICYDYQAANLIRKGRSIEIIVPAEGTFTYEKGLLSNGELLFEGDTDTLLLAVGLRLLNGECDPLLYPDEAAYATAGKVTDYDHFATVCQDAPIFIKRNVQHKKIYMSIDHQEHQFFALIYIICVVIWVASVMRRSMQKGVRYAALCTGIILIGWIMVRLIKYQIVVANTFGRYLWYAFYIFQLSLPLIMLWMAWAIDKPEDNTTPPKRWWVLAVLNAVLILIVFTNDLHGFVFRLDLRTDWAVHYDYGITYYIVLFTCMAQLVSMFALLLKKSIKVPRKEGLLYPFAAFVLFAAYTYGYLARLPIAYESDITIMTGLFTMLMFEACIRSGLIPVNTKYIRLFTLSPLQMQIVDNQGIVVISSTSTIALDRTTLDKALTSSPMPIYKSDDSLLFANPILGGYALWHEDISKLNQLYRETQESMRNILQANTILAKEEKLKRIFGEESVKKELMAQLEIEVAEKTEQLSSMIDALPHVQNYSRETARIALLLCYIKRRCNLFFRERETSAIPEGELAVYIDELCEIAGHSNVQIVTAIEIEDTLPIRHATLFYDFLYAVIDWAANVNCPYIIEHLRVEDGCPTLWLLPSEDIKTFKVEPSLASAIAAARGRVIVKDLDDAVGISLSFSNGGAMNE